MSFVDVYQFVCLSFPFGFECGMWDLILLIQDHCLSVYILLKRAVCFCINLFSFFLFYDVYFTSVLFWRTIM